jgi:PAS domain S-box-containing protein
MSAQESAAIAKPAIPARPAILIVEDEIILAKDLQESLIEMGYDAYAIASSAEAAIARAQERRPDLVLMDIRIKGRHDGIQTAIILKNKFSPAIVYLTAHADDVMVERAKQTEPFGYMLKPVNPVELRTTVEIALYRHQLEQARAEKAELEKRQQMAIMELRRAVNENNESFRMMIEAVKDYAIVMLDVDGRISSWNLGADRLTGYCKEEIVGQHFSKFYTADDLAAHKPGQELEAAVRLGRMDDLGWRVRKDGTQFFADVLITAVHDSGGQLRGFSTVTQDVTARRNAERRLYETSALLRTVLDSASGLSIIATDPSLNIKVFNAGAERLLGYSSDEIVGLTTALLLHDPAEIRVCGEELSAQLGLPVEGAQIFQMPSMHRRSREWSYLRKDGGRVAVELVVTPMQTYEGELLGYVGVAQDVTQRNQYEQSLRRATLNAERANSAKSLFLANMSHEIRTPMHAVIGLTYLLEQTALNEEQTGFVAQINAASKSLLAVITDVLDISKIEAGELIIARVAFGPRVLLDGLYTIMRAQAELKGISLGLDVPDDLPAALEGDASRLHQILSNLLSNAIKFTERGSVTLLVRALAATATASTLSFTVRDTGIGIDPAAQARLFAPFIQADESITRRYGGTGLGLSIIHSLTKLMGGTVDFMSSVGMGSEFRVVLQFPLATAESLAERQPAPVHRGERPLSGVRVLVVDDYDLNLVVTQRILEQAGALVCVANNGQEAYEKVLLQPEHFDVVLMDVQMPIMDGYEATRRIRAELRLVHLPIIALTAGALSSERQRATAVGMDDFIIKPFDAPTLIASVMRHAGGPRSTRGDIRSASPTRTESSGWAAISGIDMQDARTRLWDDAALFRSLLQRFISDFSDMAVLSRRASPAGLGALAGRLHKLKGAAGILGAKAIQRLAAETEAACVAGDATRVGQAVLALVTHLDALRSSTARAFNGAWPAEAPLAAPDDASAERQSVAERDRLLTRAKIHRGAESDGRCGVLLVDDDDIVRTVTTSLLERSGYRVHEAASGEEALRALRDADFEIVITDWQMPGMSGLDLCRELRLGIATRDLYLMILTASDRPEDVESCSAAGADGCIVKGTANEEIVARVAVGRQIRQSRSISRAMAEA